MGKETERQQTKRRHQSLTSHPSEKSIRSMRELFKSHAFFVFIGTIVLTLICGAGVVMILPSNPRNGYLLIALGLLICTPFYIFAYILWKNQIKDSQIKLPKGKHIKWWHVALPIVDILAIIIVVTHFDYHWQSETIVQPSSKYYVLVNTPSDNINTPKIPSFIDMSKIHPSENVTLTIGTWSYPFNWSNFKNGTGGLYITDNLTFRLFAENGRIYVDTSVYGGPNFAPIQIHGTSFVVTPPNWDQNYNENEFEVVNQDGNPVFQLIYKSQFDIVINGIFPSPNGYLLWATPSGNTVNPSPFSDFHLTPMFKYPSSKYLGQFRSQGVTWGVTPQNWLNRK